MTTNILIVDDSTVSRMVLGAIIKEHMPDANLIEAKSGDDALSKVGDVSIDMAIIDYNMPGMTGLELFDELAKITPIPRRALLTANIQDSVRAQAETIGVVFLNKPINEAVVTPFLFDK